MMKFRIAAAILAATIMGAIGAFHAPSASAATQHASSSQKTVLAQVATCPTSYYRTAFTGGSVFGWERYNVDPYYPNVTDLGAYHHFVASAKGKAAAGRLRIPYNLLKKATPCIGWLMRGEHLNKMLSGGFWSAQVKLDPNVKVDFIGTGTGLGKQSGPVRAWYTPVRVGNTIYVFVVPFKCGNAGEIILRVPFAPPVTPKKPKPAPTPKIGKVNVTKVAKDSTGKVMPTPTGTFVFQKVTNALSTNVTYNYNPQSLGTCVIGQSVKVNELKPLAGNWQYETPVSQTKKCTSNTHFVFIDREVVPTTTPAPAQPVCTWNGSPVYTQPANTTIVNGVCITIIVICGNVGNNNGGNCNGTPPVIPTTPPAPVQHHCTASVSTLQKDERTATFTATCDGSITSAIWTFSGNGRTASGTTVTNTFPDSEAGKTATGSVTVYFSDGASSVSTSVGISIPTPPPLNGGDSNPPPQQGG